MGDKCLIDVLDGFVAIWVVVVVEDIVLFGSFYFRSYIPMNYLKPFFKLSFIYDALHMKRMKTTRNINLK